MRVLTLACVALCATQGRLNAGEPAQIEIRLPGAPAFSAELQQRLRAAWQAQSAQSKPRTRHLNADGSPKYVNRLVLQSSPYLQQHAYNPVNWYPWGDEAFETARKLGRPVLLSIGYSTCHWCHVMEEESFEDEEIARYLNENYIAIKVDREERPDIDAVYMSAVQALTAGGGWPMTVWLTPDRKPFYAGTYFPPRDGERGVQMGFLTLLEKLRQVYAAQPDKVAESAAQLSGAIRRSLIPQAGAESVAGARVLRAAADSYARGFDSTYGGSRGAPKFPSSLPIRFLLRYHRHTGDKQSLAMATLTLEKMAAGGVYDQVGGGFHRYSTDARWLVPHFEKMLYDNALLAMAYLEAYQVTGRPDFARVARETLGYVARDMTSPDGAFYSASDADSLDPGGHRKEGWFYTWTLAEIETALGKERARIVDAYYAVTPRGNLEGRNILHVPRPLDEVAKDLGLPPEKMQTAVNESRGLLYQARAKRPQPLRDDKILAAWNGLMISAYAQAGLILGDDHDTSRAANAADFILTRMRQDGRLRRSYRDGRARHDAYLDDYAFLTAGVLDLYEATGDPRWLGEAIGLDQVLAEHYEDSRDGGFFLTSDDHERLLAREKPSSDGAEPSGNSVEALNLLRLYEFTTDDRYRQRADKTLRAFGQILTRSPAAMSEMLLAVDYHLDTPKEVVIITPGSRADAEPFLARLRATYLPNRALVVVTQGEDLSALAKVIPLVEGKVAQNSKATAYVCERQLCQLPTTDPAVFAMQIHTVRALQEADEGRDKQPRAQRKGRAR